MSVTTQDHQRSALAPIDGAVEAAALRACGFEKCTQEVRIVTMEMARRYGLELPLRHLLPIDGKPYITRDGLLHVAHRSGKLDGIVLEDAGVTTPGAEWWARVSVYRKDMTHPFAFTGRYAGQNKKFGPEMAIKVAECMGLRRAFDVSAPVVEEDWQTPAEVEKERARVEQPLPPKAPAPTCEAPAWAELQSALKALLAVQPIDAKAVVARVVGRVVTRDSITTAEAKAAARAIRKESAEASAALAATAPVEPAPQDPPSIPDDEELDAAQ